MKWLLPILLVICNVCQAQNYQCLQSGVKHYFTNSNGYLRGIRIDSVKTSGDSTIYYPYHTPRGNYEMSGTTPLDSNGGSWLGKNVMQLSDGTFLFDNLWQDTVVIKTQANIGDTWIFYRDTTTLYYKATLLATDTMTVLGVVDSVKRILVTAQNPTGIVTTDPADSFQIILSKNNGFVQVFDLYTFPYHAPGLEYAGGFDFYLDYITSLPYYFSPIIPTQANSIFSLIDFIDPTFAQLYQWAVGDVYEYSVCNNEFDHYGGACNPAEYYYVDIISSISFLPGYTYYNYGGQIFTFAGPPVDALTWPSGPYDYSISVNSGDVACGPASLIDTSLMPEEYHQSYLFNYMPNDSSYCMISPLYTISVNLISGTLYDPPSEVFTIPTIYKSSLGLIHSLSAYIDATGYDVMSQQLIYYERGGVPCGGLLNPTSVTNLNLLTNSLFISPNPATNELTISCSNLITTISITNLLGQSVLTNNCNANKVTLDVANLPSGVYFIKVNGSEVRKFVKE